MLDKNVIPQDLLDEMETFINVELAKRCFPKPVKIQLETDRHGDVHFKFLSEPFNTVPAIMKTIQVSAFGSGTSIKTEMHDNKEYECISVWISVHVSYEHWDGGTNGTKVFDYFTKIYYSERYGELQLGKQEVR